MYMYSTKEDLVDHTIYNLWPATKENLRDSPETLSTLINGHSLTRHTLD